jgi:formylglycine-generating enzyme required for sulfatase activity
VGPRAAAGDQRLVERYFAICGVASNKTRKPYRLLSEAEYEYAARAESQTRYPWGSEIGKGNANCHVCGSQWDGKQTAPVGSFVPNQFGLYDMVGNVWEWTEDCWHDNYNGASSGGSAWTTGDCIKRVIRGGYWDNFPEILRSACRSSDLPASRLFSRGFRVGRTLTP